MPDVFQTEGLLAPELPAKLALPRFDRQVGRFVEPRELAGRRYGH
jgi:hypothetical protein